jgi:excinuclease ABC subunit B
MFQVRSDFRPTGDQPQAIKKLSEGLDKKYRDQTLLGVTGSGKTFTMAKVIEKKQRPTLVMSHNKTLAAQLYNEFKQFFPANAVHYFVSYYDYYQPEAYIPQSDTYIEKEATINEEIDRLRHATTQSLINRRDVIIVASVSCIYGIGEKEDYEAMGKKFYAGQEIKPNEIMRRLVGIQYGRDDKGFLRGSFRIKGENIDIHLATGEGVVRLKMFGDEIERIYYFSLDPHSAGEAWMADLRSGDGMAMNEITILPAKHFMTSKEKIKRGIENIKSELKERTKELEAEGKSLEADRLRKKTNYDLEMIEEVGYCNGIENYSRHLSGRKPGQPPATLLDFFPDDYLMFIDESHVTIPQIGGMYAGDQSRKQTLVDFGFRLPSAKDNRPLDFQEFNERLNQVIYVSATPSVYEKKRSKQIVEQLIRPTGLLDPKVEVRPTEGQIADLIEEVKEQANKGERVLVTTLTKRMSEELTDFLSNQGIKVRYLHSEIDTLQRVDILRELRKGEFDCLVGINLLREGLDLPEVSLVVILDADMAGFLRNETSLMQTMGRAARHPRGRVVMYADKYSDAMRYAINETNRRRKIQEEYNKKHGIIPKGTKARLHDDMGG